MSQKHADLLKLLLPPVAYDNTGTALSAEIEATGTQLDAAQAITEALLIEIDPRTTDLLLDDWERVYGLPDGCSGIGENIVQRRANLLSKVSETGGLSKRYFLQMAELLGYRDTTINTFIPSSCEMTCEMLLMNEPFRFIWKVNLPHQGDNHTIFRAGTRCDARLDSYAFGALECQFMRLKPAQSQVIFTYKESVDETN